MDKPSVRLRKPKRRFKLIKSEMKQKTEKPQHRNFKMMLRNHMIN